MSRTATITLPAELIDQVIDHLHDDVLALRACCITSRAWVSSARYHIFHDILLSADRADAFAMLLETSPHISHFVKSLNVKGEADQIYNKSDYLVAVVPAIAPKLTRLKKLRIDSVTLANLHPKVLSALIQGFPVLEELYVSSVTFDRFRDFAALIVAHPSLKLLDLGHIWWGDSMKAASRWENVFQEYPDSHPQLRCITLNDTSVNVLDWLRSHYRVLPIHTFTHSTVAACLVSPMARFLHVLGPSLEHLTFCIHSMQNYAAETHGLFHLENFVSYLDISSAELIGAAMVSSNTSLRSLTFDRILLMQQLPQLYAWVPVLLSQVTSRRIEEVSFVLVLNGLVVLQALDLERIQDILSTSVFGGLKRIVFRLVGEVDAVGCSRDISRRMDRLANKKLLVCRRETSDIVKWRISE